MKNMPRSWDIWIATLCRCLIATASAVAAPLTVESVVPAVGRVGETFRVVLAGGHLKEAQDLLFYGPGLACIGLEVLSDNEILRHLAILGGLEVGHASVSRPDAGGPLGVEGRLPHAVPRDPGIRT